MSADSHAVNSIITLIENAMTERLERSFCMATLDERRGRLRAIIGLSVELERLRAEKTFATGLAEQVICDIIEGEWDTAHNLGMHFTFEAENEALRTHEAPRWAKFVEIVRIECALAENRAKGQAKRPD